jgi:hypothetical protein
MWKQDKSTKADIRTNKSDYTITAAGTPGYLVSLFSFCLYSFGGQKVEV